MSKLGALNAIMIIGSTVSWLSQVELVLRLIAVILTIIVGCYTLEKLIRERRKALEKDKQ